MLHARLAQINHLIRGEQYAAAHQRLDALGAEYPDEAYVFLLRAVLALSEDQPKRAEQMARTALSLDADSAEARSLLASALNRQRRPDEALDAIGGAIALDPTHATHYAVKAQALVHLEAYAAAEQTARAGLSFEPDDEDCRNMLAMSLNLQGKRDVATDTVGELLALNPTNPSAHTNAGYVALHRGDIEQARTHFVEALRLDPRNAAAQGGLAECIKATNPPYRWLIAWGVWMHDIGSKYQWGILLGLLLVVNLVPVLIPFYLAFLLWNWMTSPISTAYLLFHPQGRYLVPEEDRPYAYGIAGCLMAAVLTGLAGLLTGDGLYLAATAAFALASISLQQIISHERSRKALLANGLFLLVMGVLATTYVTAAATGGLPLLSVNVLIWTGVLYSWVGPRIG